MKFFFLPVLFFTSSLLAQDSLLYSSLVPRHAIKVSPLHLMSFYPTIQLAYEMKVAKRFSLQLEAGYVLNYKTNTNTEYQNKRGIKAKLELHYYLPLSKRANLVYYGAAEVYWNAVNFDRSISQQECFDPDCNHLFTRNLNYNVMYREPGAGLKFGFIKYFNDFLLDINTGFAIRFITYTDSSIPANFTDDVTTVWNFFTVPNEDDRTALSPIIGIRFGYRF